MSTPEQDAILGRALREYQEAKKTLAALHAEAEHFGNYFTALGNALRAHHSLTSSRNFGSYGNKLDPGAYPTTEKLTNLIAEIEQTQSTKNRLAETLRNSGYDIKD